MIKNIIIIFLTLLPVISKSTCLGKTPEKSAENVFNNYRDFYLNIDNRILSEDFFNILEKEAKCRNEDICAIDSDQWLEAQDGEIIKLKTIEMSTKTNNEAKTIVHFIYTMGGPEQIKSTTLIFTKPESVECWVLSDLIGQDYGSLKQSLIRWHEKYNQEP